MQDRRSRRYGGRGRLPVHVHEPVAPRRPKQATDATRGTVELAGGAETDAGLVVQASDPRLSDARTPVAHAASHAGSDRLTATDLDNTGLKVRDTGGDHALTLKPSENLSANRTLSLSVSNANRSLTISGDTTLAGGTHSGDNTGDQTLLDMYPDAAKGDILYFDGAEWLALPAGVDGQFLMMVDGLPAWGDGGA